MPFLSPCTGDTPCRPALAPLAVNTLPSQQPAVNPFSLTAQRHKAVGGRPCQAQQHEQQQQQTVRFALDSDGAENRVDAAAAAAPSAAATPAAAPPVSTSRGCVATGGASAGASPSPYVLFRGRLSFAAEVDSVVRKFDARPPTSGRKAEGGAGLKRKLAISPGGACVRGAGRGRLHGGMKRGRLLALAGGPVSTSCLAVAGWHGLTSSATPPSRSRHQRSLPIPAQTGGQAAAAVIRHR